MSYYRSLIQTAPSVNARWTNCLHSWSFDNSPDDVISNADLTLIGSPSYGTGVINQSLVFDGVNDQANLPANIFIPSGSFTINLWVKINSFNTAGIFDLDYADVGGFIATNGADKVRILLPVASAYCNTTTLSTGVWYMLSFTHLAGTNYKTYVNGVLSETVNSALEYSWASPSQVFGNLPTVGSYFFNGEMDIISFWHEEKDATFLLDHYDSATGHQYPN